MRGSSEASSTWSGVGLALEEPLLCIRLAQIQRQSLLLNTRIRNSEGLEG